MNHYKTYFEYKNYIFEIICNEDTLLSLNITDEKKNENSNKICEKVKKQLKEYFNKERKKFDLKYNLNRDVDKELIKIPYGKTYTYTKVAKNLNKEKAVRSVASLIGKNNILIVVPCHRVISKSGKLSGYKGGLDLKEELLNLESSI